MASFEQHCQGCIDELGQPFEQVHRWLDAFFPVYGFDHRPERHHAAGVEEVRQLWGDQAAAAAENHIRMDYGYIPTKDDADFWKLLR